MTLIVVRIEVREGEELEQALYRFKKLLYKERIRPWHKRRYGYYEKPGALRQKRRHMKRLNWSRFKMGWPAIKMRYLEFETQWRREGPSNAIGR